MKYIALPPFSSPSLILLDRPILTRYYPTLMDTAMLLGLLAGAMTTASFVPQLAKAWRSHSTRDISLTMYIVFTTGVLLWLLYGIFISSVPVIAANIITLIIALIILVLKIKYH